MPRSTLPDQVFALVLVAGGGALGTYARYGTELLVGHGLWATLLSNLAGCFLLGLLLFDARADDLLSARHRLGFGTGFCASFTTYSTFALDAATTSAPTALAYVAASYVGGFAAVLASRAVVGQLGTTPVRSPTPGDSP